MAAFLFAQSTNFQKSHHGCLKIGDKVLSGPKSVAHLERTLIFERCVVRCGSKNGEQKRGSRFTTQHNWGHLHGLVFLRKEIITITMKKIFLWAPKIMREMVTCTIWF